MKSLIEKLSRGVSLQELDVDQITLMNDLVKKGIVIEISKKGNTSYKLNNNVKISQNGKNYKFEVLPNRFLGVFFEGYDPIFDCRSDNKEEPSSYCVVYALNPDEAQVKDFCIGNEVKLKVLARGYDTNNEGLLVRLPASEEEFFKVKGQPCVTIGLAPGAIVKNTGNISFNERVSDNYFLTGTKGLWVEGRDKGRVYTRVKDIDVTPKTYSLTKESNGEYKVEEIKGNKLYR